MDIQQEGSDVLEAFRRRIGLKPSTNPQGVAGLTVRVGEKDFQLQPSAKTESMFCFRRICALPDEQDKELTMLRFIAEKNCFFRSTGLGVLGTHQGSLYYSARVPLSGLDALALENFLEACVNLCNLIEEELAEVMEKAESPAGPQEEPLLASSLFV